MKKYLSVLAIFFALTAYALTEVDKQDTVGKNQVINSGFENGLAKWSVLNGTIAVSSNQSAVGFGNSSAIFTPDGTAPAAFKTNDFILSAGLYNPGNCLARVSYKGQASGYGFSVLNDTNAVIYGSLLTNQSSYAKQSFSFPCPTTRVGGGKARVQLVSYGKRTDSVMIDDVFFGEDYTSVSTAIVPATWMGYFDSDCNWATTSTPAFQNPTADVTGGCTAGERYNREFGTVRSGSGSASFDGTNTSTRLPRVTFTPPRIGLYQYVISAIMNATGSNYFSLCVSSSATICATGIPSSNLSSTSLGIGTPLTGITTSGIFEVTSLAEYSLYIQIAATAGTATLGTQGTTLPNATHAMDISIHEIR